MKWRYRTEVDLSIDESVEVWHPLVAQILGARGYQAEDIEAFLYPTRSQLFDPWLMKGMEEAVHRIEQAILQRHRLRIYGDYDVDGVCSVALMCKTFEAKGLEVDYYIPDRHHEGYGISLAGIEDAHRSGVDLLIALDCGSSDLKAAQLAAQRGLDLLICDHHLVGSQLPECVALLNPKQPGCSYPQKELSAAAVGFKLIEALTHRGLVEEDLLWSLSDLVALSLVADQMPLVHEARVLLYEGLNCLRTRPQVGLLVLMDMLDCVPSQVTTETIAFRLAPPLNAAGRMAHAEVAVQLLLSKDKTAAQDISNTLYHLNNQRRAAQEKATTEALRQLEEAPLSASSSCLYHKDWHPGVVGIVAARCMESYPRPTLVLTQVEDRIVGSMRSIDPIDAREALEACASLLLHFGGHQYAAGCSLHPDQLEALKETFTAHIEEKTKNSELTKELWIDLPLHPTEATWPLYKALQQLEPYGKGNPQPIFYASHLRAIHGSVKVLKNKHFRCQLPGPYGQPHTLIGFNMASCADALAQDAPFHVAYNLETNTFNGETELRLRIQDLIFD